VHILAKKKDTDEELRKYFLNKKKNLTKEFEKDTATKPINKNNTNQNIGL